MNVPLVDLKAQYARIAPEIDRAVADVLRSQSFILGQPVRDLEQHLSAYLGTPHTIGVASGSDALLIALMALDIGPGDGVITTPYSFFATASSITRMGATPIFLDIDPVDYNLDPAAVEAYLATCRTSRTKAGPVLRDPKRKVTVRAILPVHLYGQCARIDRLVELARAHGLKVIEDAAQAIGSFLEGRAAGAWGDIGCFSFYPSKNLGAAGDAGAMVTGDTKLAERLRLLRAHGSATTYIHAEVGINSRLDNIQAAVLDVKLKHIEAWNDERRARAAHYVRLLDAAGLLARDAAGRRAGLLTAPPVDRGSAHNFHQFVVRSTRRDALVEQLRARGIGHAVYYPLPLHRQPCYAKQPWAKDECPHADQAAKETLALPMFAELTAEQQQVVVEALAEVVRPRVAVARA